MKLNGSATHTNTILNFKYIGSPIINNNSTTFNGTATLTMKNGPVTDVSISIILMNGHAISIWLDPLKTDRHFGNTTIYGSQHLNCVNGILSFIVNPFLFFHNKAFWHNFLNDIKEILDNFGHDVEYSCNF